MTATNSKPARKISSCYSISHEKDVDGLASAAIVLRYAKKKALKHQVVLTDYGALESVFSAVKELKQTLIIITDIGFDASALPTVVQNLKSAVANGCRIVWLDHHHWPESSIRAILSLRNKPILRINHDYCASEIACKVLMPNDAISQELARIAHDTDFNLRELDAATALTDAISLLRFDALDKRQDVTATLMPLLKALSEEGITGAWDEERKRLKDDMLEQKVRYYRKEKTKRMRKALSNYYDVVIHNRLVRIVELPSGVTTTDFGTFLSDPENLTVDGKKLPVADLLVTVGSGGKIGFRRGRETVRCDIAAKLFNGGGHPFAAGGDYGMYDNFEAVCDDISVTLAESRAWVIETTDND